MGAGTLSDSLTDSLFFLDHLPSHFLFHFFRVLNFARHFLLRVFGLEDDEETVR
jgi:hypothetical protein